MSRRSHGDTTVTSLTGIGHRLGVKFRPDRDPVLDRTLLTAEEQLDLGQARDEIQRGEFTRDGRISS